MMGITVVYIQNALSRISVLTAQTVKFNTPQPQMQALDTTYLESHCLIFIKDRPAIYTLLNGAFRTWRIQNAIIRGKVFSGGFKITILSAGIFLVSLGNQQFFRIISFLTSTPSFGDFLYPDRWSISQITINALNQGAGVETKWPRWTMNGQWKV